MEIDDLYEERKTPGGFLVKVRLEKLTYVVFTDSGPEIPRGSKNNSIVVNVPRIAFLGSNFDLSYFRPGELSFVNVKQGKMVIPYEHSESGGQVRTIFLNTGSASDQLPVLIYHFKTKEELISAREEGTEVHHLVLDESFPRKELINLKIRYPLMNILIIKRKLSGKPPTNESQTNAGSQGASYQSNQRATDIIEKSNLNMYSGNPVFLARIHLRNLELEKVKQLLLDFQLKPDEVEFIRTFLEVMIKNENQKAELNSVRQKLQELDEGFRLAGMILEMNVPEFEAELEKGFSVGLAGMVYALLEKEMDRAEDEDQRIILWEWKLITKRFFRKTA